MPDAFQASDLLDFEAFANPARGALQELLPLRLQTGNSLLTPLHLLLAAERRFGNELVNLLDPKMLRGQQPQELFASLRDLLTDDSDSAELLPLTAALLAPELRELVHLLEREFPANRAPLTGDLARLVTLIHRACQPQDQRILDAFFDVAQLQPQSDIRETGGGPLFDDQGQLVADRLTEEARDLLAAALTMTAQTGHMTCQPTHLLVACFDARRDDFQTIFRVYGSGERLRDARDGLVIRLRKQFRADALPLHRKSFGKLAQILLDRLAAGTAVIDPAAVLLELLESAAIEPYLNDALTSPPLRLNLPPAIAELRRIRQRPTGQQGLVPSASLPPPLSEAENLTQLFRTEQTARYLKRPQSAALEKSLSSLTTRVVVIHGEPGVGRSALVEELAWRSARGEASLPVDTLFLRFDAEAIADGARAGFLRRVTDAARRLPNAVLVIENFHLLATAAPTQFRAIATDATAPRIVGITTTADFSRHVAIDNVIVQRIYAIPLAPPEFDEAAGILDCVADRLEAEFKVKAVRPELVNLVQLADRYLSSLPRPKRAVELLRWACDEARYAAKATPGVEPLANFAAAAAAVSERCQIPQEQILGAQGDEFFRQEMSRVVIGQPEAVAAAARCLQMALSSPPSNSRPVGVFLFAGLSGTGKTFLAQQIARFYCQDKIKVYALGEFQSAADTTRFTGAAPQYVGYEDGGGIVNWLLANPRSVMLFDEIEKAHPKVLDVFLQLFDQGWIEDGQGRIGRANQAVLIMTSNVGHEVIQQGVDQGLEFETIAERALTTIREERTDDGQVRFRPEFLNRFTRLLVFRPLSEDAYRQIALNEIEKLVQQHRESNSKLLEPASGDWTELASVIARYCLLNIRRGRAANEWLDKHIKLPVSQVQVPPGVIVRLQITVEGTGWESRQIAIHDASGQIVYSTKEGD